MSSYDWAVLYNILMYFMAGMRPSTWLPLYLSTFKYIFDSTCTLFKYGTAQSQRRTRSKFYLAQTASHDGGLVRRVSSTRLDAWEATSARILLCIQKESTEHSTRCMRSYECSNSYFASRKRVSLDLISSPLVHVLVQQTRFSLQCLVYKFQRGKELSFFDDRDSQFDVFKIDLKKKAS